MNICSFENCVRPNILWSEAKTVQEGNVGNLGYIYNNTTGHLNFNSEVCFQSKSPIHPHVLHFGLPDAVQLLLGIWSVGSD